MRNLLHLALLAGIVCPHAIANQADRPNVVIIFCDDLGYADIGPFDGKIPTPHLDRMAKEGRTFTNFYAAQAVCSASRAALLTGCYSNRVGINGALGPAAKHGISADEMTIAELVKQNDYATACYGKWHLGHHKQFLPMQHGFDDYFGLPYSNDMWPYHPGVAHLPMEERIKRWPHLPLIDKNETVNDKVTPDDQTQLTTQYTNRAVKFIEANKDNPFFLYVPHSMPHVPLYVSDKFKGKSEHGVFGDVIMEIDWSVGQILDALKRTDNDENTLVVFTSDNGPWLSYGDHAGSAAPLREGKGTTWEGGQREPTIMRWPAKIPAGTVCDELSGTIDLLPTIAAMTGAELPKHTIDGKNIMPLMTGENATSPHDYFCFYWGGHLQAIRSGDWKLHFPHGYRSLKVVDGKKIAGSGGNPDGYTQKKTGLALFNLKDDIGELHDVADANPKVVAKLKKFAHAARQELGDTATKKQGSGVRPPGRMKMKALIVEGQNNHKNWPETTPMMKAHLESTGLFEVDVIRTTAKGTDPNFKPDFSKYKVVVSNYNGAPWPAATKTAFEKYMKNGGGLVSIHAADNSFPKWRAYNEMIGLGGWGGRNEKSGPYVYFDKNGKKVVNKEKGGGGHHGKQHPFTVVVRDRKHPITRGMPTEWLHAKDELYDKLRGPANNMNILATAFADPSTGGSGRHEPMLFTIKYGKGRVFHNPMGHGNYSHECVGFITTLQRGAEWAATGKVTQKLPKDFPTAKQQRNRKWRAK